MTSLCSVFQLLISQLHFGYQSINQSINQPNKQNPMSIMEHLLLTQFRTWQRLTFVCMLTLRNVWVEKLVTSEADHNGLMFSRCDKDFGL